MNKQLREWYESHNVCVNCGQRDAEPNKKMCFECSEKNAEKCRQRYYQNRENEIKGATERKRLLRQQRNEKGLCTECGKRPQYHGTKMCWSCRNKHQKQDKSRSEKQGRIPQELRGNGVFCYHCCKPLCNGQKLCDECYRRNVQSIAHARQFIDLTDRPFQKLNDATFGKAKGESNERRNQKNS